eukprot:354869-Chlamydomonas_euryale.AAC.3
MEPRRSTRIRGEKVDYAEIDENDRPVRISSCSEPGEDSHGLFDLMGKCGRMRGSPGTCMNSWVIVEGREGAQEFAQE